MTTTLPTDDYRYLLALARRGAEADKHPKLRNMHLDDIQARVKSSEPRYTAYTFDSNDQRVLLGEHLTAAEVKELRRHEPGVGVDEEK